MKGNMADYQKLYESLKDRVRILEQELAVTIQRNTVLEAEARQWQNEKGMQQAIIQQSLNASNATNNAILEENKKLKEDLAAHHCNGCDGSDGD